MRNVTKDNITDVFKGYMADDMPPRTREIMSAPAAGTRGAHPTCTTSSKHQGIAPS